MQDRYGSADVLELRDVQDPVVGQDDAWLGFTRRVAARPAERRRIGRQRHSPRHSPSVPRA